MKLVKFEWFDNISIQLVYLCFQQQSRLLRLLSFSRSFNLLLALFSCSLYPHTAGKPYHISLCICQFVPHFHAFALATPTSWNALDIHLCIAMVCWCLDPASVPPPPRKLLMDPQPKRVGITSPLLTTSAPYGPHHFPHYSMCDIKAVPTAPTSPSKAFKVQRKSLCHLSFFHSVYDSWHSFSSLEWMHEWGKFNWQQMYFKMLWLWNTVPGIC
jgi:hypothetical protein